MKRIFRNYIFWTYQRGSAHYDVMVTLILLFIFVSPRFINFRDRPVERTLPPSQVMVKSDGHGGLTYQIDVATLSSFQDAGDLTSEMRAAVAPISGDVTIDRYEPVKSADGKTIAYRVWAHR
ncbi:MAG: hypothetical protein ACYCOR_09525 [Acidobacteriaceae bacterium]